MKQQQLLTGWANYPVVSASVFSPLDQGAVRNLILEHDKVIARGNGKSYGDAALGEQVISMLGLNRVLDFDTENGIVSCEAGVLLSDLLPTIVQAGWFFHVTPGIKHISVGGAIASDVHGKNHPTKGCFSNWLISFELMVETGDVLTCSKEQNSALFWQTCGGMGWTGVILSARFRLLRILSTQMRQRTIACSSLEAIFEVFEQNSHFPYAAGWIDTTASGEIFGRGAVHFAEHLETSEPLVWAEKKARSIPFFAPSWLLNPFSIRVHNAMYFQKNRTKERVTTLDAYFYPLDAIQHWNRLYSRRGFVQYQFCIPEETSFEGIRQVMDTVRKSQNKPFLSVLKKHGERPAEAVHSFPEKGYSLALDFPRTGSIFELVKKLDALVWDLGGKIYLTKDACSDPKMGRILVREIAGAKFWSALRERISR